MRSFRQAIKDALASRTPRIVTCVRVERLDGQVFRWTNHDRTLKMNRRWDGQSVKSQTAVKYVPDQGGADATAVTSVAGIEAQSVDLAGPLLAAGVPREDILADRFSFARVYVFRTKWDDAVEDDLRVATGWWRSTKLTDYEYTAAFESLAGLLDTQIGQTVQPTCRHELGDSICRVDLENGSNSGGDFTVTGTLTEIVDAVTIRDSNRNEIDDHFGAGFVEITSGKNQGLQREVDSFTQSNGEFVLWDAFPFPLEAGDTYKAVVGCRKRRDPDCKDKFGKVINYGGAPDLPGEDVASEVASRE